jgi:hypothetical protein
MRTRVTAVVHDADFSDLGACTFWLPPGLPLSTYQVRLRVTKAWTNATLSIYPATTGLDQWIRLDNVSLKRTPGLDINGTECLEPAEVLVPPAVSGAEVSRGPAPSLGVGRRDADPTADEWTSGEGDRGASILRRRPPIDLDDASGATLTFSSLITGGEGIARVQVSVDGLTWWTLAEVPPDAAWTGVAVDLSAFAGRRVWVQFAFTPLPGETAKWLVTDVRVIRRH